MLNALQPDPFAFQREDMVRAQLSGRGIRDQRVLEAFRTVPRHEFVLEEFQEQAYDDHPLPIGSGQTISQPYIVAVMLQHLALESDDRALEIGAGSGYATALLSQICREVYAIERHRELATRAEATLARLGYTNAHIRVGDGTLGWPEDAPFDAVLVSAAAAELPPVLFSQLRESGRIIVPVGPSSSQELQLIRKIDGLPRTRNLEGCRFVPLVEGE